MLDSRILALTEDIYDAAAGGSSWDAIGAGLARLLKASNGWICVTDHQGEGASLLYRAHYPDEEIAAYQAYYRHVDLWTLRTAKAVRHASPTAPIRARTSGTLVPDAEYVRSEFYTDLGRRVGLRHVVGTVMPLGAAGLMPVCLHRADGEAPFEAGDARVLDQLLPHLRRAMQLRHRLKAASSSSSSPATAALDALSTPVVVVDAEMQVVLANAAAETIVAGGTGLRLVYQKTGSGPRSRVLAALHHDDDRALGALVQAAALEGASGGGLRVRDASLAPTLAVLVSPLPRRLASGSGDRSGCVPGQALVLIRDLRDALRAPPPDILRRLFGLTAAEAEVACALYGGATKAAVAAQRGSREATVKSQVDAILSKTGAANLRDLERLLASLR
jgi:DNA-binding CsgD family transcriptional regulator/PAS domain-containing protein